jgi:PIN domain nuclease of toxin-antitoxin system
MTFVVDTHAYIWFLTGSARLGQGARTALNDLNNTFVLPATALGEACWIVEKGRTPIPSVAALLAALDADPRFSVPPLTRAIIERGNRLTAIGEMHDRQIVATTLLLIEGGEAASLLTYDTNITASGLVPVVW